MLNNKKNVILNPVSSFLCVTTSLNVNMEVKKNTTDKSKLCQFLLKVFFHYSASF